MPNIILNRRAVLRNLLSGSVALSAPVWMRAEATMGWEAPGVPAWSIGWETVGREAIGPTAAGIEGKWPAQLQGVLYRNGPAWFDRAGFRYQHWFDGDGMVQSWHMHQGRVTHQARMVATPKFVREQQEGRFLVRAAGTRVPGAIPVRNNDDLNTANTSVFRMGRRVFALWEGGSAFEIDPDTLRTSGPVTWRPDLAAMPFSAHPLVDRDGTVWNFGSLTLMGGSGLVVWRISADGGHTDAHILETGSPGYLHSFVMTERFLVFVLTPLQEHRAEGPFFETLRFASRKPDLVAVVPKNALDAPIWLEVDFAPIYHFADAYERGDEIVVRAVRHHDLEEARSPMANAMRGEPQSGASRTELASLRLPVRGAGKPRWESHGVEALEFPITDTRFSGDASRIYAPITTGSAAVPYFNAIAGIDTPRGRRDVYSYDSRVMVEEHLFVPKSGRSPPGEGWLLGTMLDYGRKRSGLAVFEASDISRGPIAQAWVPYHLPLGFHGLFAPAG